MGLFGSEKVDPKKQVDEWTRKLRKEQRGIDRQIRSIQREEDKVKRQIKTHAKKGEKDVCLILAKEVVQSKKAVNRLYAGKAQMNSVSMHMKNQLALLKISGVMQKSGDVMKAMQTLIKLPEISATMMEMSKEMMKAGIIEEMMDDVFENLEDQDELEEAAQEEVDKILFEVTAGALGQAPTALDDELPMPQGAEAPESDEEEDVTEMQARLEALRS
ncbi:charged multivesicular body protein 3-like [Glandiceps talaboti]